MPPLIEREKQFALAVEQLERSIAGDGGLIVLDGMAGTGKTRLIMELGELARSRGVAVLSARGGELETGVTYGVARQLFERRLHAAPDAERERLLAGAAQLARAAIGADDLVFSPETGVDHGLYWLVANLEGDGPVTIVVDDVQWADAESQRFLLYLARRVDALRVLIVVAVRTGEETEFIRLLRAQAAARIVVEPLSAAGSEALLSEHGLPVAAVAACHRVSGGNPFFLGEIARALDSDRTLIERIDTLVPDEVRLSILLRLGRLGERARRVAEAIAIVGDGASPEVLAEMLGEEVDASELARAGITDADAVTSFAHPVIRTAIYADIGPARREELHAAAARSLTGVEEVAHHLALTHPGGDAEVSRSLLVAGERALARDATDTAIRMLRRALAEPPAEADAAAVLVALGEALVRERSPEAVELLERALVLEPSVRAAVALAPALSAQGRVDDAFAVLEREGERLGGAAQLRPDTERALIANWIRDSAQPAWRDVLLDEFSRLDGHTPEERFALVQAALARALDRDAESAMAAELARRALGDGALTAEFPVDSVGGGQPTYVLVMAEEFADAERELAALAERARGHGSLAELMMTALLTGQTALAQGRLASAAAEFEAALDASLELGESPVAYRSFAFATTWLVEALVARGDVEPARGALARAEAMGAFERPELVWARAARGFVALDVDHDAEGAAADFLAFGEAALAGGYEERGAPWRLWAARALSAAGDVAGAVALADEQLLVCRAWGAPGALGAALRMRAVVGETTLEPAIETLRASAFRLELARALLDYGRALRRAGRRSEARPALEEAMDLAARCEARPLATDARGDLVVLGARPRREMFSGVEALTAAERRVAERAASGLGNREIAQALFVTEKTVETHLHRVFRKLGISSRRELPEQLGAA